MSRLSEPSNSIALSSSAATIRSKVFVWATRPSMTACTTALPSALPSADHLVVALLRLGPLLQAPRGGERALELRRHLLLEVGRDLAHQRGQRGPLDLAAVDPYVAPVVDADHADDVVVVGVVGVVGEAVVLLLGVVQHQAELHALPGKLPVGEAPEPGQDRGDPRVGPALGQVLPRLAAGRELSRHPREILDQELASPRSGTARAGHSCRGCSPRAV